MSLNVIMLGPPASGKGTQAIRLAQARGIPKISTGDILREAGKAGTALGLKAKALMDRGELVSDEDMVNIVRSCMRRPGAAFTSTIAPPCSRAGLLMSPQMRSIPATSRARICAASSGVRGLVSPTPESVSPRVIG